MPNRAAFFFVLLIAPFWCRAQTPTSADRATSPPADATQQPAAAPKYPPFTEKVRLREYVKSWVSPVSILMCATGAGWGQLWDAPKEWGEGAGGYWTRFASAYGQHLVNSTLLLTSTTLLHEDNRYVPSGDTATGERLKYALTSSLVTRHDDGDGNSHRRVSFSRIVSFAGAAVLSRAWQPPSDRGLQHAAVSFGASVGITAGFNVLREFLDFK